MNGTRLSVAIKRIGVVGSRTFKDYELLQETLKPYLPFVFVSGGAVGADKCGEQFARENDLSCEIYKPDWKQYGKRAGFIRNETIVQKSELIIAFWDGKSKGTRNTISLAKKYNVPVRVVYFGLANLRGILR
jgi:hypothetical protein